MGLISQDPPSDTPQGARAKLRLTNAENALQRNRSGSTSSPAPSKAIAGWALARVIDRDRSYARVGERLGEPKIVGRILGAEHPDQHCAAAAPTRNGVLLWAHLCVAFEAEFSKPGGNTDPDRAPAATSPSPPSRSSSTCTTSTPPRPTPTPGSTRSCWPTGSPATVPSVEQHTGPALMIRAGCGPDSGPARCAGPLRWC